MNTAQILRSALFDINAVFQNSTTDPFYKLPPLLAAATDAKNKAEKTLRAAREDFNLLQMQSNDVSFRWCGVDYDPSSLTLVDSTRRYQLPPDLLMLKSMRCTDDSQPVVTFTYRDVSSEEFQNPAGGDTGSESTLIYYDVVGENTLILSGDPPDGVEVEITYIPRTGPLQIYSTGTVTLTQGSNSVSGGGTSWVASDLRSNLELIVSADGTAPKIISSVTGGTWVDPSTPGYPVASIDSEGGLTLAGNWLGATAAGRGYILATVPALPEEHHQGLVDYVAYRALRMRRSPAQAGFKQDFAGELAEMRADIQPRQEQSPVFIEDWNP
jgi:hypothetical protein